MYIFSGRMKLFNKMIILNTILENECKIPCIVPVPINDNYISDKYLLNNTIDNNLFWYHLDKMKLADTLVVFVEDYNEETNITPDIIGKSTYIEMYVGLLMKKEIKLYDCKTEKLINIDNKKLQEIISNNINICKNIIKECVICGYIE